MKAVKLQTIRGRGDLTGHSQCSALVRSGTQVAPTPVVQWRQWTISIKVEYRDSTLPRRGWLEPDFRLTSGGCRRVPATRSLF